jgi:hypothetical protein
MRRRRSPWQLAHVKHIHLLPPNLPASLTNRCRALVLLGLLSGCASGGEEGTPWDAPTGQDGTESSTADAGFSPSSVGTGSSGSTPSTTSSSGTNSSGSASSSGSSTGGSDAVSSDRDAGTTTTRSDASSASGGGDIDDLIGGLFGDGDAATKPPPSGDGGASGEWTLEPDSADECPPEPPPIPIVGGACLGLYYTCNWRNAAGETYFCTCDWVHWLCI